MTFDMTTQRTGRFTDPQRGMDIAQGYEDVVNYDPMNKAMLRRNFKPYAYLRKQGYTSKRGMSKFQGKTDTQLYNLAATAVLKDEGITPKKLPTRMITRQYSRNEIERAKRVMGMEDPRQKALRATREARQHIKRIRRNREVMSKPFWPKI